MNTYQKATQDNNVYSHYVTASKQEVMRKGTNKYLPMKEVFSIAKNISPVAAIIMQAYFDKADVSRFNPLDDKEVAGLTGFTVRQVSDARRALTKAGYIKTKKGTFDVSGEAMVHVYLGKEVCGSIETAGEYLERQRKEQVEAYVESKVGDLDEALFTNKDEVLKHKIDADALFGSVNKAVIDGYADEVSPEVLKIETKYPNLISLVKSVMELHSDQPTIINEVSAETGLSNKIVRTTLTKLDGTLWFSSKAKANNKTIFKLI